MRSFQVENVCFAVPVVISKIDILMTNVLAFLNRYFKLQANRCLKRLNSLLARSGERTDFKTFDQISCTICQYYIRYYYHVTVE